MSVMGPMEVAYFQLTPIGAQRVQQGYPGSMEPAVKSVLKSLAFYGGTAEWDELKLNTYLSPMALKTAVSSAVDLGLVIPLQGNPQA